MPNNIQGLPPGATLKPIEGLPAGAELRPIAGNTDSQVENANPGFFGPVQDAYDSLIARQTPEERQASGPIGAAAADLGRGVAELGYPVAHPVKTGISLFNGIVHPSNPFGLAGDMVKGAVDDVKQNGIVEAGPHIAGQIGGAFVAGKAAPRIAAPILDSAGGKLRTGAAGLNNAVIGTTAEDMEFGADPGRALAQNRVIGSNPATLAAGVKKLIPGAAAENRAIIAAAPVDKFINAGPLVSEPFDSILKKSTNDKVGVAAPGSIKRANLTRSQLTNVIDEATGKPTANLRNPYLSPLEATQFKSNIYDMTDYDNPSKAALANRGLKGAAHNLKVAVENAVPESVESGQNLHDLMAAKDVLDPRARLVKIPTSKSGLIDRAATYAGTAAGASGDALGTQVQNLARFLNAKRLSVPAPILAATAGSRQN